MRIGTLFISFFMMVLFLFQAYAQNENVLIREEFRDLEHWRPLYFPKIKKHTTYSTVKEEGKTYLRTESIASASAIVHKKEFDVYEYPRMRWKWKAENVYKKGNVKEKSGDDYPLRVYVIFKYDPLHASLGQKIRYGLAKKIYGEYPPHSSLSYIWANRKDEQGIVTNPYADESKMVIREAGPDRIGQWREENVHVVDDYRKAFGTDPPAVASVAVMNDSDNTGERSISYIEYIEVYK